MIKNLTDWIQSNPFIIFVMFAVSLVGGLMTIVLGWKSFYQDYLSKTFSTPIWLVLLALLLNIFALLYISTRKSEESLPKDLVTVAGMTFGVQQVILDGRKFQKCEFNGTELVFNGDAPFSLENCSLNGHRITFNKNASTTLQALGALYRDPAFRPTIENTFASLKADKVLKATPVQKQ